MMKQTNIFFLITMLMSMVSLKASAYDIAVNNDDGVTIYYNYIKKGTELSVTKPNAHYEEEIINIPELVTFMNRTRRVTSIGENAFFNCSSLTSVTIPNSVTSIRERAFDNCSSLTSVNIPNSVTSIGDYAFFGCSGLTSVNMPNSVTSIGDYAFEYCRGLTSVNIPNSVTSIGDYAFSKCSGLTSANISSSVIGNYAFEGCSGLTSVNMPNSVTSIGDYAFFGCSGLTSVNIPNSVTSIGIATFCRCSGLTSVIIPDSVTSIGGSAFEGCSGLTSVNIPNSVTSIGGSAFYGCSGLASLTIGNGLIKIDSGAFEACDIQFVVSFIENPFKTKITSDTFSKNTILNATLYVPEGTIDKYRATSWWQDFVFIEEGTDRSTPPPTPQKCEKPTISYMNGKLTFNCETEGAICHSTIKDTDIKSYNDVEVQLSVTYNISVYATKAGYENSDVATAALCWIDANPKTEGIESSVAQVRANPILIQANNGEITVTGADDGASISAYSISGRIIASKLSNGSDTKLITDLKRGEVVIIKINEKTVKLIMQ